MKNFFLHIFFLFIPALVFSQLKADNLVLYPLAEQNGLSDNQVNCFFQDSKGFMWIGTQEGLNRFDGSLMTAFTKKNNDSTSLADNSVFAITEDDQKNLWMATKGGLCEYDPQKNIFHSYGERIIMNDLCFDEKGDLWITTWGQLIEFIPSQKKFIKFINHSATDALTYRNNNRFTKIIVDNKKRIWLATYNGLWQFIPASKSFEMAFENKNILQGNLINEIYPDHEGKIWLGYWNIGLKKFDPDNQSVEDFNVSHVPYSIIGISETKNLQNGYSIWCNGLAELDPRSKICKVHAPLPTEAGTDYDNAKLFTSKDGLLWIGTDKGIRIMDPYKQFFHHYSIAPGPITNQTIALSQKGYQFYIGGNGEYFFNLYDSDFRFVKKILPQPSLPSDKTMEHPALLNLVRENDHSIWLCTEQGLILLDEKNNSKRIFRLKETDIAVSTRNFFSNIFIDSKGNHWVFPWRSGIWQLDISTGHFKKMISGLTKENGELKNFLVTAAAEDANGNIWFADIDEGLLLYDIRAKQFLKPTEKIFGSRYGLQNVIAEGKFIWGVKTGAVFRINTVSKQTEQWTVPDEFNKTVTGFCSDHTNHLWITTSSGLLSFDKNDHSFKRYTANDGLVENLLSGTIFSPENGKIFYAAKNYVIEFDPNEIIRSKKLPPVIITNVLSQNKMIEVRQDNKGKYIELGSRFDNFIFNWTILNYSNPLQNRFYCKLEGVDKDWKFVGYRGEAQYASLQPGKYVLKVKAETSEGSMSDQGDMITIIIHPPFWRTWWFILSVSFVLLTAFIAVVRYVSQRNLKEKLLMLEKEQAIEKERNRISRDMHDDLGSGLTKIAIMSEVVKKQLNEPEKAILRQAQEQLENISESSRELVDNLQDIIWVLNPKNDTLESLAAYIREYTLRFFEPFGTEINFVYPEKFLDIKLSEETRRNIFLTVKECFNNIGKHAWCNKVMVNIDSKDSTIILKIKDDGKGFDINKVRQFSNGLTNMQNRIEQIGGKFEIQSELGKGTEICMSVNEQ